MSGQKCLINLTETEFWKQSRVKLKKGVRKELSDVDREIVELEQSRK